MTKWRIVKDTDGVGCETYHIERKGWLFWHRQSWYSSNIFIGETDYEWEYDRAVTRMRELQEAELGDIVMSSVVVLEEEYK